MEVAIPETPPCPAAEFNFDSNCSSPYMTAPSSPQRFANFFFSAPASPARSPTAVYDGAAAARNSASSAVPFDWGEKPRSSKNRAFDEDFAFDFSGNLEAISLSAADELFDGGKIRPMTPRSKRSLFPLSPRHRKSSGDAAVATGERNRRERSRSVSPIRVSDIILEQDDEDISSNTLLAQQPSPSSPSPKPPNSHSIASIFSTVSFAKSYRKWKLRDLLLFRSASEGRATGKEAIGKYAALPSKKAATEDLKNSSFRSTESTGSAKTRAPAMSAHEMHYTVNRAAAEEMRKKTMLPYKRGLLGCLGLNQEISRGIGSLTRGRS